MSKHDYLSVTLISASGPKKYLRLTETRARLVFSALASDLAPSVWIWLSCVKKKAQSGKREPSCPLLREAGTKLPSPEGSGTKVPSPVPTYHDMEAPSSESHLQLQHGDYTLRIEQLGQRPDATVGNLFVKKRES